MTDYPITPPPELVKQWFYEVQRNGDPNAVCWMQATAANAAQWGADQELEACCAEVAWLESSKTAKRMRERRRPAPPTLKEQALAALEDDDIDIYLIRRALEALPND